MSDGKKQEFRQQKRQVQRATKKQVDKAIRKAERDSGHGMVSARARGGEGTKLLAKPAKSEGLGALAASFVWPAQVPGVRYSDYAATTPTALASPWRMFAAPWSETDVGETLVLQTFRSALHAYNVTFPSNEALYLYNMLGTSNDPDSSSAPAEEFSVGISAGSVVDIHTPYANAASVFQPHGPRMYGGFPGNPSSPARFFWMSSGTTIGGTVTLRTAGADLPFEIILVKWSFEESFEEEVKVSATADLNTPLPWSFDTSADGYYALAIHNQDDAFARYDVSVAFSDDGPVTGHNAMPKLLGREQELIEYRIPALAGMYKNTAAPGYKAGDATSVQVPAGQDWRLYSDFDTISAVATSWNHTNEDGAYRWVRPVEKASDFKLLDEYTVADGVLMDCHWDMTLPNQYGVIAIKCPAPTDVGGNPKIGKWFVLYGLEYVTDSPWPALDVPGKNVGAYDQAMRQLADVDGGSTNKGHMKLLNKIAKNALKGLNVIHQIGTAVGSVA